MKNLRRVLAPLILSFLVLASFGFASADPLRIAVYVDSDLSRSFSNDLSMKTELVEVFHLASRHFEREIGRSLDFSVREYVRIPDRLITWLDNLKGDPAMRWFRAKKLADGESYKYLMTPRLVKYNGGKNSGIADPEARLAIAKHSSIRQIGASTLLHELGHLCGIPWEEHSSDPKSFMHLKSTAGSTYGEFVPRIKEMCGEKKATEDFAELIK